MVRVIKQERERKKERESERGDDRCCASKGIDFVLNYSFVECGCLKCMFLNGCGVCARLCFYLNLLIIKKKHTQTVPPADALAKLLELGVEQNVAEDAAVVLAEKHKSASFKGGGGGGAPSKAEMKKGTKAANGGSGAKSRTKKGAPVELF